MSHFFFKISVCRVTEKEKFVEEGTNKEKDTQCKRREKEEVNKALSVSKVTNMNTTEHFSANSTQDFSTDSDNEAPTTNNKQARLTDTEPVPSTSTAQNTLNKTKKTSATVASKIRNDNVICLDSEDSEDNSSSWMDVKNVAKEKKVQKCAYCSTVFESRKALVMHVAITCILNPDSKNNKETGKHRCLDCGRSYKEVKCLRHHQKHECKQTVTCPNCGKSMKGSYVPERHKQNYCVKRRQSTRRNLKVIKKESPDELYVDDSSNESDN